MGKMKRPVVDADESRINDWCTIYGRNVSILSFVGDAICIRVDNVKCTNNILNILNDSIDFVSIKNTITDRSIELLHDVVSYMSRIYNFDCGDTILIYNSKNNDTIRPNIQFKYTGIQWISEDAWNSRYDNDIRTKNNITRNIGKYCMEFIDKNSAIMLKSSDIESHFNIPLISTQTVRKVDIIAESILEKGFCSKQCIFKVSIDYILSNNLNYSMFDNIDLCIFNVNDTEFNIINCDLYTEIYDDELYVYVKRNN